MIIADEDVWRQLAGYGFLKRLDRLLQDSDSLETVNNADDLEWTGGPVYEDKLLKANGYLDNDDIAFEDKEVARGEAAPYGVDISESRRFGEMKEYMERPVFAIAEGTKNEGRAKNFLDYLME